PVGAAALLSIAGAATVGAIALGPLIAGLGLVTAGVGTFAAAAIPEVSKIIQAVEAKGPAAKKAWAALSPPERAIGRDIKSLEGGFKSIQKAVQPEVVKAFGTALSILHKILPALKPLAVAAGKALDGFLKDIDKWLSSPSGKKFINWMET